MKKILALLTIAAACGSANATLIGDTVHIAQNYPVMGSEHFAMDAVVGTGVEFSPAGWVYTVDVGVKSVRIDFTNASFNPVAPGGQNGPVIRGLNDSSGQDLIGYSNFSTSVTGFTADRILFGTDYIAFNMASLSPGMQSFIQLDLDFAQVPVTNDVPEPAGLALFAAGLGLLGLRRKQG